MRIYEEPIVNIYELLDDDVVTASMFADCDDIGEWGEGWSTNNAGGKM